MPDHTPVAETSHRPEAAHNRAGTRALARRALPACGLVVIAAAIGLGLDALHTPERQAAAFITFAGQLALCSLTAGLAAVAPRAIRIVLCFIVPLLALSIGAYDALVGASLESAVIALCLCLAGVTILNPGFVVQLAAAVGVLAAYAVAASTTPLTLTVTAMVLVAVVLAGLLCAAWQYRRRNSATAQREEYSRVHTERARATALLATTAALGASVSDFATFASAAAEQSASLVDADWTVYWHRNGANAFHAAAVTGLPEAIAESIRAHHLEPEHSAALYDRLLHQPALDLPARDAQRLLPLDTVAPILKHALASIVRHRGEIVGILFAGYATRRPLPADAEALLAGAAQHVGIAIGNVRLVDEARSANLAKSEFIATMSHELRTPINVVMGYADLLIEGAFGDATQDQLDVLNRVRHQSAQLLDLVQPMLDLNRLEARQTSVSREAFRLIDLIEGLQLAVPSSWCKPGVSLSWSTPIDSGLVMRSDRTKVEMIVRNLIHNALKYTDQGTVSVCVEALPPSESVRIAVQDTGTGIAANDLPALFEMFGQSNSDLPRDGGVGLGLYIVKRLTDVLGGRVTVETARGVGSTFTVTLPLDAPA